MILQKKDMINLVKKISKRLKDQYDAQEVILFGSYAKGTADEDSDLDLLIIATTNERFFKRLATVTRLTRDLIKKIPVSPIVFTPEEIENSLKRGDQFIQEILERGIKA